MILLLVGIYMLIYIHKDKIKFNLPVLLSSALLVLAFFKLELKYTLMVEKGLGDKSEKVRINHHRFKTNPRKELVRYIEDVNYYNNIWRVAAIGASIISIVLHPFIRRELFIITWLAMFTVIYNVFHWKVHHFYDFVFKSLKDAIKLSHSSEYTQELHI